MRAGSSCLVFVLAILVDTQTRVEGELLDESSNTYVDFPFYGSLPLNYDLQQTSKRRLNSDTARTLFGHSLRVRKSFPGNAYAHALRVRRGRQWDALGHSLRIKRDAWNSYNHALRVRRGDEPEMTEEEDNFQNENQFPDEGLSGFSPDVFDPRPRRFMPDRRASDGIRLHTLRIKKADNFWKNWFNQEQIPEQEGELLRPVVMSNWAKRKATLNHVLRVRKNDDQAPKQPLSDY